MNRKSTIPTNMQTENSLRTETARQVALLMMAAARTAPKGRGRDTLYIAMASDDDLQSIAQKMKDLSEEWDMKFFARDAENLLRSDALILIGSRIQTLGLKECGFCGLGNCSGKEAQEHVPCAFNTVDLGIALGSAVSVAAAHHADNRIMFSAGKAALELGLCDNTVEILFGIPLSIGPKSIFFDR